MKAFLAKRMKGKLYVPAEDVAGLVEAEIVRRLVEDRPAEPDETVLAIMAAARIGDAAELAAALSGWPEDHMHRYLEVWPITQAQALRAAELLQSIADED